MQVDKVGSVWVARSTYEERAIPKAAGFRWDSGAKRWYTRDPAIAAKLAGDDSGIRDAVAAQQAQRAAAVAASRAADYDGDLPCPEGLAYLPYQRAGIAYALSRPNALIGDEMGLGKTIQAIGVVNADESIRTVLVVCPASLRINWRREMERWLTRPLTIGIGVGDDLPKTDVWIVNYDICARHKDVLQAREWDLLIADEAHYMKNPTAQRTQAVLGREATRDDAGQPGIRARRKLFLSGTPIPNRPIEAWPLLRALGVFESYWHFARRYCGAYKTRFGWDMTGATNLAELQEKLRASVMVRRLKADVLTELPAKRRAVIELPANGAAAVVDAERRAYQAHEEHLDSLRAAAELAKASDDPSAYAAAVERLTEASRVAFTAMSQMRHDVALAKVPYVCEHLRAITETGRKVVCFAHHRDVIAAIMTEFPAASKVTGEDSMTARQAAVDRFQSDPACLLFVGNIQAAGVGITLTASSHVVFAELDWVPGNVTQAEDRCHRIGQHDSVLVEHLVLEGSIDARMARTLVAKQQIIEKALDAMPPAMPSCAREEPATASMSRKHVDEAAAALTPEQIADIHDKLRWLAGLCDGARSVDGSGFNKYDSAIGKSLALAASLTPRQAALGAKLVHKYRRQLTAA
jgi:SWI/SNF-related matrix-associated actin-dependent regulator 1 of chromatin subfamily A